MPAIGSLISVASPTSAAVLGAFSPPPTPTPTPTPTNYTFDLKFSSLGGTEARYIGEQGTYHSLDETLAIGSVLYQEDTPAINGFYADESQWYEVSGTGHIINIGSFTPPVNYPLSYASIETTDVCSVGSVDSWYSYANPLITGSPLFVDDIMSVFAEDGWYCDSEKIFHVSNGLVIGITTCPTPTPPAPNTVELWYDPESEGNACVLPGSLTLYFYTGGFLVGTTLYADIGLTTPVEDGYYSDGTNWWSVTGGAIQSTGACVPEPTPTPTPPPSPPSPTPPPSSAPTANPVYLNYSSSNYEEVCSFGIGIDEYWITQDELAVGYMLYTSNAFDNVAPEGYYSDGNVWWHVNEAGVITATGSCPALPSSTPPPVYSFDLCFDSESTGIACAYGSTTTFYSNIATLAEGVGLYTDPDLTTVAPVGFYSDSTYVYHVVSGNITTVSSC